MVKTRSRPVISKIFVMLRSLQTSESWPSAERSRFTPPTSTPSVVYNGQALANANESLPLTTDCPSPYPLTKALAEHEVLAANSATNSLTFSVYGLVPTARFSDFWNFAVAIICIVLVIFRMFRTALRRFTIARALAMGGNYGKRRRVGKRSRNRQQQLGVEHPVGFE